MNTGRPTTVGDGAGRKVTVIPGPASAEAPLRADAGPLAATTASETNTATHARPILESGWSDSNRRLLLPKSSALARLSYTPCRIQVRIRSRRRAVPGPDPATL